MELEDWIYMVLAQERVAQDNLALVVAAPLIEETLCFFTALFVPKSVQIESSISLT